MRRVLRLGLLLLPPLAVLAMLAPPAAHSHAAHEHVPITDSEACAGGGSSSKPRRSTRRMAEK
ncbi:MAG: hypothetical protein HRF46_05125, partial [Acidobacteriota bacterium]